MSRLVVCWGCSLLLTACVSAQEPLILKELGGWVGAVAFAPDDHRLAIGTSDGNVALWDVARAKKTGVLHKHADSVAALAWSPNGKWLASGGHDGATIVNEVAEPPKIGRPHVFKGNRGAVLSVVFSSDGKRLFTGGIDSVIREWDLGARSEAKTWRQHTSWVNSLAVNRAGADLASASSDNSLQVRRSDDGTAHNVFRVTEGEIRSVAFSPNGKLLAAGIRYGHIRVWDLESNKEVFAAKPFPGECWAVVFAIDGQTLYAGGGDWHKPSEVRRWDVGAWKERMPLPHSGEVLCLAASSDGHWLAAGSWDRSVRVWSLAR